MFRDSKRYLSIKIWIYNCSTAYWYLSTVHWHQAACVFIYTYLAIAANLISSKADALGTISHEAGPVQRTVVAHSKSPPIPRQQQQKYRASNVSALEESKAQHTQTLTHISTIFFTQNKHNTEQNTPTITHVYIGRIGRFLDSFCNSRVPLHVSIYYYILFYFIFSNTLPPTFLNCWWLQVHRSPLSTPPLLFFFVLFVFARMPLSNGCISALPQSANQITSDLVAKFHTLRRFPPKINK